MVTNINCTYYEKQNSFLPCDIYLFSKYKRQIFVQFLKKIISIAHKTFLQTMIVYSGGYIINGEYNKSRYSLVNMH